MITNWSNYGYIDWSIGNPGSNESWAITSAITSLNNHKLTTIDYWPLFTLTTLHHYHKLIILEQCLWFINQHGPAFASRNHSDHKSRWWFGVATITKNPRDVTTEKLKKKTWRIQVRIRIEHIFQKPTPQKHLEWVSPGNFHGFPVKNPSNLRSKKQPGSNKNGSIGSNKRWPWCFAVDLRFRFNQRLHGLAPSNFWVVGPNKKLLSKVTSQFDLTCVDH